MTSGFNPRRTIQIDALVNQFRQLLDKLTYIREHFVYKQCERLIYDCAHAHECSISFGGEDSTVNTHSGNQGSEGMNFSLSRRQLVVGAGIGLGVLSLGGLAACSSNGGSSMDKTIAFGHPDTASAIYPLLQSGSRKVAAERGYTLLESQAAGKLDKQVAEINTWIAQGVAGMMILPLDNAAMGPLIKKANEKGVKFLDYSDKALPDIDGYVIFDNLQGAKLVGDHASKFVNSKLGGKAKVALLTHEVQLTGRERIGGAVEALQAGSPGAEVVASAEGVLAADTLPVVQSMLQAEPDIDVILCIADDGCLGAESAFMQTNPSQERIDKMYIAGWDGSIPVFEKILANSAIRATGTLDLQNVGRAVVEATIAAVVGKGETQINFPYVLTSLDDKEGTQKILDLYKSLMPS